MTTLPKEGGAGNPDAKKETKSGNEAKSQPVAKGGKGKMIPQQKKILPKLPQRPGCQEEPAEAHDKPTAPEFLPIEALEGLRPERSH
jgi:hypothetical protein